MLTQSSQNKDRLWLGETGKKKAPQYHKNISVSFEILKDCTEDTYIEKEHPIH